MSPAYHQSTGTAFYRRSLYTVWKRTAPMPDMTEFDAPSREVCVVKRSSTSTPQQAFVLLNDTQFVEAARVLAEKAMQRRRTEHTRPDYALPSGADRASARTEGTRNVADPRFGRSKRKFSPRSPTARAINFRGRQQARPET
jgi:hypothetical protein